MALHRVLDTGNGLRLGPSGFRKIFEVNTHTTNTYPRGQAMAGSPCKVLLFTPCFAPPVSLMWSSDSH